MQKVMLTGNLGCDPKVKYSQSHFHDLATIQTSGLLSIVIGRAGALQGICAFCVSMKDNRPTIKNVGSRSTLKWPRTSYDVHANNNFRPARVSRSDLLKASFGDLI
jgi:hypothetical protein